MNNQPYKLPDNWRWVSLDDFAECLDNLRVPVNTRERLKRIGNIPYYGATGQTGWIDDYLTNEQLVLLGEDGAPFLDIFKDKAYIIDGKAWINNHVHILKSYFGKAGNLYLKYYLNHFDFRGYVNGSTRLKLTQSKMKSIPIPLPPLEEQQRIVAIIENLFTKLYKAKALAQSVIDNYELRRSSILHRAFTGQLTNSDINGWQQKKLYEIGLLERGRSKHRPRNDPILFGGKFPFIQTGDVANAKDYIVSHKQTLSDVGLQQSRMFPSGTLCITIAANIGDVAILTYDCCFPDSVVGFTPKENVNVKYVYYKLKNIQKILQAIAPATAQKNINLKVLSEIKISLPSFEDQKEIVRILDSLLDKEQRTKELAEQILQKIDMIKKSILSRAFHGEI